MKSPRWRGDCGQADEVSIGHRDLQVKAAGAGSRLWNLEIRAVVETMDSLSADVPGAINYVRRRPYPQPFVSMCVGIPAIDRRTGR